VLTKNAGNLLGNDPMLQLSLRPTPYLKVMEPTPQRSRHVKPGGAVNGKDLPGTLLCHTRIQQLLIHVIGMTVDLSNLSFKELLCVLMEIIDAVLPVGQVLPP
jgi:hypothetical protein